MVYKKLSCEEKKKLLEGINWDYLDTEEDILDVVEGKKKSSGAFTEQTLFARCLECFTWQNVVNLWTLERCDSLYDSKVRKMIFDKFIREEYDKVFGLLRTGSLPHTGRSPEDLEKLRSTLLFNRRNRCKQRVFKSQILRRP